jgi:hypothetical protein
MKKPKKKHVHRWWMGLKKLEEPNMFGDTIKAYCEECPSSLTWKQIEHRLNAHERQKKVKVKR